MVAVLAQPEGSKMVRKYPPKVDPVPIDPLMKDQEDLASSKRSAGKIPVQVKIPGGFLGLVTKEVFKKNSANLRAASKATVKQVREGKLEPPNLSGKDINKVISDAYKNVGSVKTKPLPGGKAMGGPIGKKRYARGGGIRRPKQR